MTGRSFVDVTPSAGRLTSSLRDIGYDFLSALADVVDNSVAAGASSVSVEIRFHGPESYVLIKDDGRGMTETELHEALRFGTRRSYEVGDLGRYGLGLKTASLSQCRQVTVCTRRSEQYRRVVALTLDVDHIVASDRWEIGPAPDVLPVRRALEDLDHGPGTIVVWRFLDRVLPDRNPAGGWARRRLLQMADRSSEYLGMVFHRFLKGETERGQPLAISVNGIEVQPWDPFATDESHRIELPPVRVDVAAGHAVGEVALHRYVLPPKRLFSSTENFDRLSGIKKWNRQQGLYIYRADRMIQYGGWSGLRAADEHTKFARAAVDFGTELDDLFQINVAKMRVSLPPEVKGLLEQPIHELCRKADAVYRSERTSEGPIGPTAPASPGSGGSGMPLADIGASLTAAAMEVGEESALERIAVALRDIDPAAATALRLV